MRVDWDGKEQAIIHQQYVFPQGGVIVRLLRETKGSDYYYHLELVNPNEKPRLVREIIRYGIGPNLWPSPNRKWVAIRDGSTILLLNDQGEVKEIK